MARKKKRIKPRLREEEVAKEREVTGYPLSELTGWCATHRLQVGLLLIGVVATFGWAYWPTLQTLVDKWQSHPDYSHGFLVPPLALLFLYLRRDRLPEEWRPAILAGGTMMAISVLMRWVGARIYLDALDGYSILVWCAGLVVLLLGWRMLWFAAPSLAFLAFMIPLPYRVESALRLPLQELATTISSYSLVVLGYPAIADANVIRVGDATFGIAEACSGLRIFVGILALAVGYIIAVRKPIWIKVLLLISVLPVTLIANSTRIVVTCLLELRFSSEIAQKFSHDIAGVVMIPFAVLLFGLFLWYLMSVVRWEASLNVEQVVKRQITG